MRLFAFVALSATLFASAAPEVWNTKDFAAWTQKDAEQIITDSPWAKERRMPVNQRPSVVYIDPSVNASAPASAELGNPANTTTGQNGSSSAVTSQSSSGRSGPVTAARTPSMVTAPVGAPTLQPSLKVIWASALPVRLAVLKMRLGSSEPTAEQVAKARTDWPNYVIAVVGLPEPQPGSDPKAMARDAFLSKRGAPAVPAVDSDYRLINNSNVYFFRFPKAALPLTASDGEVEFKLTAGDVKISQRFQPSTMKYRGDLAL